MSNKKINFKTNEELQEAILQEKAKGTPDIEIGKKYNVTYRFIEKTITKSKGINISNLTAAKKIKRLQPIKFKEEETTIWSFKSRGNWATHSGEYRGNWSPYIPRNVILKYSEVGEVVLDYFCGAGTTAVESKLLGRRCIAFDINDKSIDLAKQNVNFDIQSKQLELLEEKNNLQVYKPELSVGDARNLSNLKNNSIDLICAHPPYANIIHYTDSKEGDLSFLDIDEFLIEISKVAKESYRVLKPGKQCAILIGDTRRKKHVIPLGFKFINVYLNAGFNLKELVIKRQHNCKTTGFWYTNSIKYNFLLLAHEYLPIFEKPKRKVTLSLREKEGTYGLVTPSLKKPSLKRKLDDLETTTVWIFPDKDFEKCLNRNVIDRYSNRENYKTINFTSNSKEKKLNKNNDKKNLRLLFIKSSFLNNSTSHSNIDFFLEKTKEIVNQEIPLIIDNGFLVIQVKDVRIDKYVEPLALKMIDTLQSDNLWLKEIIHVPQKEPDSNTNKSKDFLEIAHQYLLVYDVLKKEK